MKFRLNAGKPASYSRGGFSMPESKPAVEIAKPRRWAPNMEKFTFLTCGDAIPWPVMRLIGSGKNGERQVWCDQHGWTDVIRKEKSCPSKPSQAILPDTPPF